MPLTNKKVLIGITGGIAAYKICELIRRFVKLNADVKAVLTPSAREFVTEITLRTLTKNQIYCEQFDSDNWKPEHVSLADESDIFIIAPATANTIGKITNGICDNLLTSLITAFTKPIILAPAMNCNMWQNQFVQKNISTLENAGYTILPPENGDLACGYQGIGRMISIDKILEKSLELLKQEAFLKGQKIIVTAGGTKEAIDPVRYMGNHSSGKMGIAIADAAYKFGADVTLITTVKAKKSYKIIQVQSAQEMLEITKDEFMNADSLIMAAAVADFRPKIVADQKIKKLSQDEISIELVKNPDILKEISEIKKNNQLVVGFCAESENLLNNAKSKLQYKKLDFIVANDISNPEIVFESDYNEVLLIDKSCNTEKIPKMPKVQLAELLLRKIFNSNNLELK